MHPRQLLAPWPNGICWGASLLLTSLAFLMQGDKTATVPIDLELVTRAPAQLR